MEEIESSRVDALLEKSQQFFYDLQTGECVYTMAPQTEGIITQMRVYEAIDARYKKTNTIRVFEIDGENETSRRPTISEMGELVQIADLVQVKEPQSTIARQRIHSAITTEIRVIENEISHLYQKLKPVQHIHNQVK